MWSRVTATGGPADDVSPVCLRVWTIGYEGSSSTSEPTLSVSSRLSLSRLPYFLSVSLLLVTACGGDGEDDTSAAPGLAAVAKTYGGPVEMCDGVDNNANGRTDELCGQCDYLVTRGRAFWGRNQCVVDGEATGTPLLPVTVGRTTISTFATLKTFFRRPSSELVNLALGQEIVLAKLNMTAFSLDEVLYIDYDGDGAIDTVSQLVDAADRVYSGTSTAKQTVFRDYLMAFNATGTTLPLYFDPTCALPAEICDGLDNDGDGAADENCGCVEVCDGVDNDADALVDEEGADDDGDGYGCDDCDDADASIHPGAVEIANGIDDDCNGGVDDTADADGDGYTLASGDCVDSNPSIHPGAAEECNGLDDNCDGQVDEGLLTPWYVDADNDGHGTPDLIVTACAASPGLASDAGDCNDANPSVYSGAAEVCNGADDNCDGTADEGLPVLDYYPDTDNDGFGAAGVAIPSCVALIGFATNADDCNDTNPASNPAAAEVCNNADEDCDGAIDEGLSSTWYPDGDGDGEGSGTGGVTTCAPPGGYAPNNTDCDDGNAAIHHGVAELCNGVDDNCDANVDEGITFTYYRDADGDGRGSPSVTTRGCSLPSGYVNNPSDCNDANPAVYQGAPELCNGVDDNCNATADEGVSFLFFRDGDADSYGTASSTVQACSLPVGYSPNPADCDDANAAVNPGVPEVCNGIDDNCIGGVDEGVTGWYYPDTDGDGYGDYSLPTAACTAPSGYLTDKGDCNDRDAAIHNGATEILGDGIDQNCDGSDAT